MARLGRLVERTREASGLSGGAGRTQSSRVTTSRVAFRCQAASPRIDEGDQAPLQPEFRRWPCGACRRPAIPPASAFRPPTPVPHPGGRGLLPAAMGQSDPGSAPAPLLTPEQLAEYRATGILLLRGFLPADTAARLRVAALDEIPALDPLVKGKWMHFHEPGPGGEGRMLCRTENFVDHADLAGAFSPGGKLHRAVEEVAGEPMVLFKDKINYKQPGAAGFAPHQDSPAFTSTPTTHLTALVPVHPMTRANGCLEFVPGAFPGVLPQEADGTISRAWCAEREWVALECGEGDVVLFSGLVPHRSGPNATEGGRAAYYLTYNAAKEGDNRAAYWDAKRRHFPPRNEREEGKDYSEGAKMYNLGNPIVD